MAIANLKLIFGGSSGGSFTLKAGQSYLDGAGVGGINTGSLDVSSATDVISLTGKYVITHIQIACSNPGVGTMTASLTVDGVTVLGSAAIGTAQYIAFYGMQQPANGAAAGPLTTPQPPIVCNTNMSLNLQRSTADTVTVRYIALAIE